jgi:pSer/pThr/pTyr-binding forkhead associated (FHA) protein
MSVAPIVLELLDSGQGYAVQRWEFEAVGPITIGRAVECDIEIANPFVSRSHAYMQCVDAEWRLVAVSKAGVFVDGQRITELALSDETTFRLAERGPLLRFREMREVPGADDGGGTIQFDADRTPLLVLHETERDREVAEIAESPYFQELQKKAARFRQNRPT